MLERSASFANQSIARPLIRGTAAKLHRCTRIVSLRAYAAFDAESLRGSRIVAARNVFAALSFHHRVGEMQCAAKAQAAETSEVVSEARLRPRTAEVKCRPLLDLE